MTTDTHTPATDTQSLDTILSILSDRGCRAVVDVLDERNPPIDLHELATVVASREPGAESDDRSTDRSEDIAVRLYHVHVPKLDDADGIDYDPETDTVTSARTERLAPFLTGLESGE